MPAPFPRRKRLLHLNSENSPKSPIFVEILRPFMIQKSFFLGLAWFFYGLGIAQIIPAYQQHNWKEVCDFPVFNPNLQTVSILDHGGISDSTGDNAQALSLAIQTLNGEPGIVLFPAGKYVFNSTQNIPSGVVIQGAGADSTRFYFDLGGSPSNCFQVTGGFLGTLRNVIQGYTEGSSVLSVSDTTGLIPGGFAEIRQTNGSWDSNPASWATYSVGQVLFIDSIRNNQVFLKYPLRITYDSLLNPQMRPMKVNTGNGFSCFYIERIDEPSSGAGYNFLFDKSVHGFLRGVQSNKSVGSHVMIELSSHIQVQGNYFYDAFTFDGSGTRGYGVTINNHSGSCLIENNIFRRLRHAMMVKHGANGNVFAYNYSREPKRSEPISDYSGDISLHGHYPYANLFEGNIVQNIMTDHYWGPAGPDNVFLRNRAELYGIIITTGTQQTADQVYIGNETTNNGFLMGNFTLPGTGHFSYGNNVLGTTQPSGTSALSDTSYYRTQVPAFWFINHPWPSVGYPTSGGQYSNPAKERYEQLYYSLCSEAELGVPSLETTAMNNPYESVFPNPNSGIFSLPPDEIMATVRDISGRSISFFQEGNTVQLTQTTPGIYMAVSHTGILYRILVKP